MAKQQNWRKVACPCCKSAEGQNCFRPPGTFGVCCYERRLLADEKFGVRLPGDSYVPVGNRKLVTKE